MVLQRCVLMVPSRHGQVAICPCSQGTGTGPSFALSVSTIAEQAAKPSAQHARSTKRLSIRGRCIGRRMVTRLTRTRKFSVREQD